MSSLINNLINLDILLFYSSGGIFDIYEIIPGFFFFFLVIVVVSLMGKPHEDMLRDFDKVKSGK